MRRVSSPQCSSPWRARFKARLATTKAAREKAKTKIMKRISTGAPGQRPKATHANTNHRQDTKAPWRLGVRHYIWDHRGLKRWCGRLARWGAGILPARGSGTLPRQRARRPHHNSTDSLGVSVFLWSTQRGGLCHAVEAELCVAMPNQPLPAQASVSFFEQTIPGVLRNHQGLGIQQM